MSKSTNKNKSNANKPYALSTEEIEKIVENSQRIEGYEPASKEMKKKVEAFMKKHNIKVSF